MVNSMFKRNKELDIYTPQREDKNKGRKRIAWIVGIGLFVIVIGVRIFSSDELPGGTPVITVDQTGQTPSADIYTPNQQAQIEKQLIEQEGTIPESGDDAYGKGLDDAVNKAVAYAFANLAREDNPNIRKIDAVDVMARMKKEEEQWKPVFYSEKIAFQLMQLFNLTTSKPMDEDERASYEADGVAVANPSESYALTGDGIVIEDITPKESPYYVLDVVVFYQTEASLPVRMEFHASVTKSGRIFNVEPISIETQQSGGE